MVSLGILGRALRSEAPSGGGLLARMAPLALAGGGLAMLDARDARAEEQGPPSDSEVRRLETELELFRNPKSEDEVKEVQRRLRGARLYAGPIDGDWKGKTEAAARQYTPQLETQLGTAKSQLEKARGDYAYLESRPPGWVDAAREIGPWAGIGLGILSGHMTRHGAVKKAAERLLSRNQRVNALLTDIPLPVAPQAPRTPTGMLSKNARDLAKHKADLAAYQTGTRAEVAQRAGRLNDFWIEGGAGSRVPFETVNSASGVRARPQGKVADVSELFPAESSLFRGNDAGLIGMGATESAIAGAGFMAANENLKKAEAEAEKRPTKANFIKVEEAKNWVKVWETALRLGVSFTAARGYMPFLERYKNIRPKTDLATSGRAWIQQYLNQQR